jgi:hypothetical protein
LAKSWTPPNSDQASKGINLVDSFFNTGEGVSRLLSLEFSKTNSNAMPAERLCDAIGESDYCTFKTGGQYRLDGLLLLGKCLTATQMNCIDSLSMSTKTDKSEAATFVRQTAGRLVKADSKFGLSEGSTISLWNSSINHAGGKGNYAVYAALKVSIDTAKNKVFYSYLNAQVFPYSEIGGVYPLSGADPHVTADGRPAVGYSGSKDCVWTEVNKCGQLEDFTADTDISLKLNLSNTLTGWFSGRLKNPNIQIAKVDADVNSVTIAGSSVLVNRLAANTAKTTPLPYLDSHAFNRPGYAGGMSNMRADSPDASQIIEDFRPVLKDTASGTNDVWSISAILSNGQGCMSDTSKVQGIVTTNAMVYQGTVPTFQNGTLEYKVAGLHYLPDGKTETEGTYDLIIRSETARCLYGFSSAPISASISVTGGNGEIKTATTTFTEKNGWIHFSAYGFAFSSPTISVKLTQAAAKKTTITCTKGKLTKKITGTNPKCPSGFRKK